jgi:hypothetical protein
VFSGQDDSWLPQLFHPAEGAALWTPVRGTLGAALLAFQRSKDMKGTKAKDIGRSPRFRRRTVRLSDYEEVRLKEQADVAGLPVAAYMRRIFASSAPVIAHTDQVAIRELRRMGGLLKNNFGALRQAGAEKALLEYQEELLRETKRVINQLAGGRSDDS